MSSNENIILQNLSYLIESNSYGLQVQPKNDHDQNKDAFDNSDGDDGYVEETNSIGDEEALSRHVDHMLSLIDVDLVKSINSEIIESRSLLMSAAKFGRYHTCKTLLHWDNYTESVNLQNKDGFTALHYACYNGYNNIVVLLIENGAKISIKNRFNENPFEAAINSSKSNITHLGYVKLLMKYNPDKYITLLENYNDKKLINFSKLSRRDAASYMIEVIGIDADISVVNTTTANSNAKRDNTIDILGRSFYCLAEEERKSSNSSITADNISMSKDDLMIGRSRSNHICLSDLSVSKNHAVISYFEDIGFLLRDLGSKHGTFINNSTLHVSDGCVHSDSPLFLSEGCILRFGRVHCKVFRRKQDSVLSNKFQPNGKKKEPTEAERHQAIIDRARELQEATRLKHTGLTKFAFKEKEVVQSEKRKYGASHEHVDAWDPVTAERSYRNQPQVKQDNANNAANGEMIGSVLLGKMGWEKGISLGKSGGVAQDIIKVSMLGHRAGLGSQQAGVSSLQSSNNSGRIYRNGDSNDEEIKRNILAKTISRYHEQR
eukprot:gene7660-10424_t